MATINTKQVEKSLRLRNAETMGRNAGFNGEAISKYVATISDQKEREAFYRGYLDGKNFAEKGREDDKK